MKKESMKTTDLFSLEHTMAKSLLEKYEYPWEALAHIEEFVMKLGASLPEDEYMNPAKGIWVHRSAKIAPTAGIIGPVVIGPKAEIRHCAYIRGKVIVGAEAVVGNSSELKNTILFDNVQVPHYNYVGDSILGYKAHMGAGSITSNVKSDKTLVKVHAEDGDIETGLKKFGAMVGDNVEVGCGSVLNPGTVIGKNTNIYPLSSVRTCVDAGSIYKNQGEVAKKQQ
ncbi:UDP-N-acetylglucosamine pyrophosphorylase [Clostridium sp. AN503]|uniref:acyltransferase n=1 Tax=Clostridium sp. AN503 TaxID=3160598 RepID=UPI0034584C11